MGTDATAPAATAARAILASQIRHGLIAIATIAVSHGVATQGQTDAIVPAAVDYLVGLAIAAAVTAWSVLTARISHSNSRWAAAWAALQATDPFPQATGDRP